jgi:cobalt-precorrin 5A hydrolase
MIAAGLGCRSGCDVADLLAAISGALAQADRTLADVHALVAPDFKAAEPALALAAQQLGKPLWHLPIAELQAQATAALTHSERVMQQFAVPSIAETAALAGARRVCDSATAVRLLGPRLAAGGATCALAAAYETRVTTFGDL